MTQSMTIFSLAQDALEKVHLSRARTHKHEKCLSGSNCLLVQVGNGNLVKFELLCTCIKPPM